MATMPPLNPAVTPDTLITIKLQHGSENKKTKLPLKDLNVDVLPAKLRNFLALPVDKEFVFERYSDSAGAFIRLDGENTSAYKQLNRAAKAKLKLRIKVTPVDNEETEPVQQIEQLQGRLNEQIAAVASSCSRLASFQSLMDANATELRNLNMSPIAFTQGTQQQAQQTRDMQSENADDLSFADRMSRDLNQVSIHIENVKKTMTSDYASLFGTNAPFGEQAVKSSADGMPSYPSPPFNLFSVCCDNCNFAIPDHHWHCETCREGDFDLCQKCLDAGCHCDVPSHYLVRRTLEDGKIVSSTTETVSKTTLPHAVGEKEREVASDMLRALDSKSIDTAVEKPQERSVNAFSAQSRTCNSCVSIYDDSKFVTCKDCADYDLCLSCHVRGEHGHHPAHTFAPAVEDMVLEDDAAAACEPGRNQMHDAICDGCDFQISGVRYKCLECPDWDYCASCHKSANYIHPFHRFVPVYESLEHVDARKKSLHVGVRCDGPMCVGKRWIVGVRFKCAICDDTDFCANCEAHPTNAHSQSHPLIKFRVPQRDVSITTYHTAPDGASTEVVGDRQPQQQPQSQPQTSSRGTETTAVPLSTNASTQVQETPTAAVAAEASSSTPAVGRSQQDNTLELLYYCRHKMQRALLSSDHAITEEDVRSCEFYLSKLEIQDNVTLKAVKETKMHKVLKRTARLPFVPLDNELAVKRRCYELLKKWTAHGAVPKSDSSKTDEASNDKPKVEDVKTKVEDVKTEAPKVVEQQPTDTVPLDACYISDYISDGTKVLPGQSIYQSWTMSNPNSASWPKGCALRWAGGDHMIDIDMTVPGSMQQFDSASMSNATHARVNGGSEYSFSVKLRAPLKTGRAVSYWRLYSPDGKPFGHRLWCDVEVVDSLTENVQEPEVGFEAPECDDEVEIREEKEDQEASAKEDELSESQMVFPKLDKESPASSTYFPASSNGTAATVIEADAPAPETATEEAEEIEAEELVSHDDVESVTVDLDEDETTDDGFMTDEDYDMLEDARE